VTRVQASQTPFASASSAGWPAATMFLHGLAVKYQAGRRRLTYAMFALPGGVNTMRR